MNMAQLNMYIAVKGGKWNNGILDNIFFQHPFETNLREIMKMSTWCPLDHRRGRSSSSQLRKGPSAPCPVALEAQIDHSA